MSDIKALAREAYLASAALSILPTASKNAALEEIASALQARYEEVMAENRKDVSGAVNKSLPPALVDRLTLNEARYNEMVLGIRRIAKLQDPVGRIIKGYTVESGLEIVKKSVPFGVVGVIYEARPNVTADVAALCLKSGNACILRGGSEAIHTNRIIHSVISDVLKQEQIPQAAVSFIDSTDRSDVKALLTMDEFVDVIIPRGGESLHRLCRRESTIPVIVGGFGICHMFVDKSADLKRSCEVIVNAKKQKPSACNALDTLLIHEEIAEDLLKELVPCIRQNHLVCVMHDDLYELGLKLGLEESLMQKGKESDFDEEWLSLKFNLKKVRDLDEVLVHMRVHRANHSDAILTNDLNNARRFAAGAGSACVYINASTRFTDGGQFGMGAEVAVSTQKLHVRGPMALEDLTTYQYVCSADYLSRA